MAKRWNTIIKEAVEANQEEIYINWLGMPSVGTMNKCRAILEEAGYTPDCVSMQQIFRKEHPVKECE